MFTVLIKVRQQMCINVLLYKSKVTCPSNSKNFISVNISTLAEKSIKASCLRRYSFIQVAVS